MDEQELLHKISVETNVNIELLKDSILHIRRIQPRVELMEAKMIVEACLAALK
jgi:hypothetical protein